MKTRSILATLALRAAIVTFAAIASFSSPSFGQQFAGQSGGTARVLPPYKFCFGQDNGQDACFMQTGINLAGFSGSLTISGNLTVTGTCTGCGAGIGSSGAANLIQMSAGGGFFASYPGFSFTSGTLTVPVSVQITGASAGSYIKADSTGYGTPTLANIPPGVLYSAAGTPLGGCGPGNKGQFAVVSDATTPTYMGAYASGGGITATVICSYNGSTYSWLTH